MPHNVPSKKTVFTLVNGTKITLGDRITLDIEYLRRAGEISPSVAKRFRTLADDEFLVFSDITLTPRFFEIRIGKRGDAPVSDCKTYAISIESAKVVVTKYTAPSQKSKP